MIDRPFSMTILGGLLILGGALGFYQGAAAQFGDAGGVAGGMLVTLVAALAMIDGMVRAACGFGVLSGQSWARVAFLAWGFVPIIFVALALGLGRELFKMILFYVMIANWLCRRSANIWFEARTA